MRALLRGATVLLAAAISTAAATGLALPASAAQPAPTAQAAAPWPCPRILAVCAQTAEGELRIITRDERAVFPPIVRAANNTPEFWCFYSTPGYGGDRREVAPWETVEDFGFEVFSVRHGQCTWE